MNYNKKVSNLKIVIVNRPRIYLSWNSTKKSINKYDCYERIKNGDIRWISQYDRTTLIIRGDKMFEILEKMYKKALKSEHHVF